VAVNLPVAGAILAKTHLGRPFQTAHNVAQPNAERSKSTAAAGAGWISALKGVVCSSAAPSCNVAHAESLPGGHFFVDQFPTETARVIRDFLADKG